MVFKAVPKIETFKLPKRKEERTKLPGYGLPLDYVPKAKNLYGVEVRSLFPTALDDRDIGNGYVNQPLLPLREIEMMKAMENLTENEQWHEKVHDDIIAARWKKEIMDSSIDITPRMADWIIEELRFKAKIHEHSLAIGFYNGDVTKSDCIIDPELRHRLLECSKQLNDVQQHLNEYTPDSGWTELDVVQPTLFPLIFGRSRILKDKVIGIDDALEHIGQGEIIPKPADPGVTREDMVWRIYSRSDINVKPFSTDFQMLPAEVQLGEDGKWHLASYINNLHPEKHKELYGVIEEIIEKVSGLWEMTLTPVKDMLHSRARIEYHKVEYEPLTEEAKQSHPVKEHNETEADFEARCQEWKMQHYRVKQPDAGEFRPWAVPRFMIENLPEDQPNPLRIEEPVKLKEEYGERGLQVYVRVLDINLTPERPEYSNEFHVEGQMNERICASALYYYDADNVQGGRMAFRQTTDTGTISEIKYEPGDSVWLKQVFGLDNGAPAVQEVGSLSTQTGRVISYPSTLQHRIEPLRLIDPTRPGYRRILGLYLVDPNIRIISTANIPPQRLDWTDGSDNLQRALSNMSIEDQNRVLERKDGFPFTLEEAHEFRQRQRKERIEFLKYQDVAFTSNHVVV
ncbi:hypothetical protein Plec18167_008758 [Paecilomyces lecythidis]|uniref:Uncharacterized protein n=1 Tax=Paecilomyces lecythidis TaxID=3004212 RepID=A0ABR3WUU0_9EURO